MANGHYDFGFLFHADTSNGNPLKVRCFRIALTPLGQLIVDIVLSTMLPYATNLCILHTQVAWEIRLMLAISRIKIKKVQASVNTASMLLKVWYFAGCIMHPICCCTLCVVGELPMPRAFFLCASPSLHFSKLAPMPTSFQTAPPFRVLHREIIKSVVVTIEITIYRRWIYQVTSPSLSPLLPTVLDLIF